MRFPATTIDLSTLPAPQIIDQMTYDSILDASKADVIARAASVGITIDTLDIESELITVILEACAYRELAVRKNENDDALALLLPFANGPDLEQIGVAYGVIRMAALGVINPRLPVSDYPEDWETDDRLRRRIQLAPDAYSNAGTLRGYEFHTLSSSIEIIDCNVFSPIKGQVDIVALAESGAPSDEAMQAIYDHVTSENVKPLTDDVRVSKATILPYTVAAVLRIPNGPDPGAVKAEALTSARAYAAETFKIGRKVYTSGYISRLQVSNVFEVLLSSPFANLDPGSYAVGKASFNVTTEITDG